MVPRRTAPEGIEAVHLPRARLALGRAEDAHAAWEAFLTRWTEDPRAAEARKRLEQHAGSYWSRAREGAGG